MATFRYVIAGLAILGAGAAVMSLSWWTVLALPAVVFALAVDPHRPLEQR
jgi:hypothetical protein